jgi:hypothetical protein
MKRTVLVAAALLGCAKVDASHPAGGGGGAAPSIAGIDPAPGTVESSSAFRVAFSAAMDEGVLLAATGRSETVVLAAEGVVERAAAAIEHSRLSAEERALLVAATAFIETGASAVRLVPDQPLAAGAYFLLASSRLRDTSGRHVAAAARFRYDVAEPKQRPGLVSPPPGALAAANLARVRAQTPAGPGRVALVAASGAELASAPATGGIVELPLCPAWSGTGCAALHPGETYSLALDGDAAPGQTFTAAWCPRLDAPRVDSRVRVRDTSVLVDARLDWPVRIFLEVGAVPALATASADAVCAPDPCNSAEAPECAASVRVDGLTPGASYDVRLAVEDDEGHALRFAPVRVATVPLLPKVRLSEVMASPPLPLPRSDGEYVEIWNEGTSPADVSALALSGADGVARPLLGAPPPVPVVLAPGGRALAVGASFDASRYDVPEGVPVLRTGAQRLLGHGLADDPLPAISLVGAFGGTEIELASFAGGGPSCPVGVSVEMDGPSGWKCGREGGSPGTFP